MDKSGGKKTCKYYSNCGNIENCLKCTSYIKKKPKKKSNIIIQCH